MFAQFESPSELTPYELDQYLANGWFRMHQTIFTTHFLCFNEIFYSAVWLRVGLENYIPDKKQSAIYRKNKCFRTEIRRGAVNEEHENLYRLYRESVPFTLSETLQGLLLAGHSNNKFDTYTANIYDGDELVAAGVFDMGSQSAAGISCFYHPAYKKHSLGKHLMYLKIDFCRQQGLRYFYPGYIVPGYRAFDYKQDIGTQTLEYLALENWQWLPYAGFSHLTSPLRVMETKLEALKKKLADNQIGAEILYYRFFDAGLDTLYRDAGLFDFPVFLQFCPPTENGLYRLLVYDIRDGHFYLLLCRSVFRITSRHTEGNIFFADLLQIAQILGKEPAVEAAALLATNYLF